MNHPALRTLFVWSMLLMPLQMMTSPAGVRAEETLPPPPAPGTPSFAPDYHDPAPLAPNEPIFVAPSEAVPPPLPVVPAQQRRTRAKKSRHFDPQTHSVRNSRETPSERPNLWVFFGTDAGYSGLSSSVPGEAFRSGYQVGFKLLGSYYLESPYVLDFGAGWVRTQIEAQLSPTERAGLINRAGFIDLGARYRWNGSGLQIGPYLDLLFGTDLSFNPEFNPENRSSPILGGLQVLYEIPSESSLFRIGGRLGTSLSIPDRQLITAMISLQFGLPVSPREHAPPPEPTTPPLSLMQELPALPPPPPAPAPPLPMAPAMEIRVQRQSIQVALGSEFVNFATGKTGLSPGFKAFLGQFAEILIKNPGLWKALTIEGHTDVRGGLKYNMGLSQRRALAVSGKLASSGVPSSKLHIKAYGPLRPLDSENNPPAWAKNRRVEIRFTGVKNPALLAQELNKISPN